MRNNKFRIIQTILIVFLLTPLYAQDDPLAFINFEKSTITEVKRNFVQKGLFSEPQLDSSNYKYFIIHQDLKFPVEVSFNPDWYETLDIRQLKLNLNEDDTVYNPEGKQFINRARRGRKKIEVDQILNIYHQWYGEPDSVIVPELSEGALMVAEMFGRSKESKERNYIWNEKNFDINFYIPSPSYRSKDDKTEVYQNATILYSVKNYQEDFDRRKIERRRQLTVSDIVSVRITEPKWKRIPDDQNNKGEIWGFQVNITDILREAKEEERSIKALRFDIVFRDIFDDEISRLKNVTHEFKNASEPFRGVIFSNPLVYTYTYNMHSEYAVPVEKARRYNQSNSIKVVADIKRVLFSNGEIMK